MPRRPNTQNRNRPTSKTSQSTLRIIGGQWRSRKLNFPEIEGLRPTPDRVRETLFNWLGPYISGANCLDMYSGSGALGMEALSRGAGKLTFIDQNSAITNQLRDNLKLLNCTQGEVVQANTSEWLQRAGQQRFDIVFMDPPFRKGLVAQDAAQLEQLNLLDERAIIYVETESDLDDPGVPANWRQHRKKTSGQVSSYLYFREIDSE